MENAQAEDNQKVGSLVPARHLLSNKGQGTNRVGTMPHDTVPANGMAGGATQVVLSRGDLPGGEQRGLQSAVTSEATKKEKKKFNVKKAMKSLPAEMSARFRGGLAILNFNISGLRTAYKKESLKEMAYQMQFRIAVITETHLLNHEADALKIPRYSVLHREGHSRQKGGVLILAHGNVACRKLETATPLPRPIDGCSCMLYPTKDDQYPVRLTGIYIPQSAEATPELLAGVTQPCAEDQDGPISQLVIGDHNANTWQGGCSDKYYEWLSEAGLWELSDPDLPTFMSNAVIDKFLLNPGDEIPEEWIINTQLGEERDGKDGELEEEVQFPAVTFPCQWVADHHPLMMILKGQQEDDSGPGKHNGAN